MKMDENIATKMLFKHTYEDDNFDEINDIVLSIDGYCYHKYWLKNSGLIKKFRQEGEQMETLIHVSTMFQIPKQYFYSQICEEMNLNDNLISETLNLLWLYLIIAYIRMKKLSFGIIGGGPAAFYTAKLLSRLSSEPIVHIIER